MSDTWAGTVALAGAPNVGKSTLLNALVGEKLSIVTPKPQTTWRSVSGIHSGKTHQIVFVDTPGLFAARDLFHRGMVETTRRAVEDADVVLGVVDAAGSRRAPWGALRALPGAPGTTSLGRRPRVPCGEISAAPHLRGAASPTSPERARTPPWVVAVNKVDAAPRAAVGALVSELVRRLRVPVLPVSALHGTGVTRLREALRAELPPSPFLFPPERIASDPVRFFVAELVRETVFELYDEEIPYSVSCRLEEFREAEDPVYIQATLYVERSSQKGILIGDGGRAIRELGSRARKKTERFVGRRVYLDLWVKVLAGWRRKRGHLRRLGFAVPVGHQTKRAR